MFKKFISFYRPYKKLFVLDFSCAVLASGLELLFPVMVNLIMDNYLPAGDFRSIMSLCLFLLFLYAISNIFHGIVTYFGHMLGLKIETDMRLQLFEHLQKMSFKYFDNNKTGSLQSRISTELFDIGELAHHGPEDMFIAGMTIIGAVSIIFTLSAPLALMTLFIVALMIFSTLFFNARMKTAFRAMFASVRDYTAKFGEAISGIRVVKAFTNEEFEREAFIKNNSQLFRSKMSAYRVMTYNGMLNQVYMKTISLFALFCGSFFVLEGKLSYGQFMSFILLVNVLLVPLQKINNVIDSYPKGIAGFRGFLDIMETEPDITDSPDAKEINTLRGDIVYKNVSFSYDENTSVLNDINLNIKAGETIAFAGASGAGKTTLCSLLPRFYEVNSGEIMIDGVRINDMTLKSLRQNIGIVQQDVYLFSGTIRENIAYGRLDASEEEILKAAEDAKLNDFIKSQKDGLDTLIGERGVKLSGGQKQRLSIARMFLKNPAILILDEATSALDAETEAAIQKSMEELSKGRTTLIIAHRLATIRQADRIVVVTENGIAEEGNHQQLLKKEGGVYLRLYQTQFDV